MKPKINKNLILLGLTGLLFGCCPKPDKQTLDLFEQLEREEGYTHAYKDLTDRWKERYDKERLKNRTLEAENKELNRQLKVRSSEPDL
jgi:hypothetical protein